MNKYIEAIAAREGISAQEVLQEIQTAIDLAWDNQTPEQRTAQMGLMGGKKPSTPEELVAAILHRIDLYKA